MINFPLPVLTALLCCVIAIFVWRLNLGIKRVSNTFAWLFVLCSAEAFLVALRFGYGVEQFIWLQRILPLLLGPMIYLGFYAATVEARTFARAMVFHLSVPIFILAIFWIFSVHMHELDWVISASYVLYAFLLFKLWRKGPDALSFVRVDITQSLSNWMLRGLMLIVFVLVLDTAIALDFVLNKGAHVPQLISYGSVPLIILLVAALIALPTLVSRSNNNSAKPSPTAPANSDIQQRFDAMMRDEEIYLDPYLSLQRIAKRLHVPAREVSNAINRAKGMNVSQYVNTFRVAYAAQILISGNDSVVKVAERSGFLTRSNFYREFQRIHGKSPNEYRKEHQLP
ncbi:MAG: AraC family transcriptional regulator [Lentilitoribacter sp.]